MMETTRIFTKEQQNLFEQIWQERHLCELLEMLRIADTRVYNVINHPSTKLHVFKDNELFGSCYIYGEMGTGKSVNAAWRMLEWSRLTARRGIKNHQTLFISTLELLHELKNTYSKNSPTYEGVVLGKYKNIPLLVLDDFGLTNSTEWAYQMLYMIINWRYSHMLPTIYTSNHSLEKIANLLNDERITSRIKYDCGENILEFEN